VIEQNIMKIRAKQFLLISAALFLVAIVQLLLGYGPAKATATASLAADAATPAKEPPVPTSLTKNTDTFTYQYEGRPDPFLPFLTEKAQANPNEIVESQEKLTGMQLFEPGQLTLVALVKTPDQKFAMVQDVSGKGYIIEEGTKIGRRGVVTAIDPNKLVIEETATTRSGRKLTNTVVMVLKKEEKKK
jgi:Tfp pilus assembly protein PilP